MFKYFLQQSVFRLFLMAVTAAFLGIFVYAVLLELNLKQPANMEAPFKENMGKAVMWGAPKDAALTMQHMSSAEVSLVLKQVIAETLSLTPANYDATVKNVQKYFTPAAYQQYLAFLAQTNMKQTLNEQGLQSGAFPEQDPLELNSGVFGTAYKWLFEVPVTMSFVKRGTQGYENTAVTSQNRRFILRTQFSRVKDADPNAIKIEIWQVSAARN